MQVGMKEDLGKTGEGKKEVDGKLLILRRNSDPRQPSTLQPCMQLTDALEALLAPVDHHDRHGAGKANQEETHRVAQPGPSQVSRYLTLRQRISKPS